jgi:hypothetical protein
VTDAEQQLEAKAGLRQELRGSACSREDGLSAVPEVVARLVSDRGYAESVTGITDTSGRQE